MNEVQTFLTLIKEKRLANNMTLQDVATIVDYSKTQIWDLEQQHSMPSLKVALKLARLFAIDLNHLT